MRQVAWRRGPQTEPSWKCRKPRKTSSQRCATDFPQRSQLKRPQPLKVGVGNEIAKMLDINPRAVGLALGFYCNRSAYLLACKEGATRVDLDGNPAGTVLERDAVHAETLLEERRAKRGARLARQEEAKRREGLKQAEAEHKAQRHAEVSRTGLRGHSGEATVTTTKPLLWSGSVDLDSLCAVSVPSARQCGRSRAFARPRENRRTQNRMAGFDHFDEWRRALKMPADLPEGSTEVLLLAHGFTSAMIAGLVHTELATSTTEPILAGGRPVEVTRIRIADRGLAALE